MKIPVIAIVGATAVGKTSLSIELAKKFDCEIVSIDSVQIYKEFNIGSAKITKEEMQNVKHHLIDELDPIENLSVYEFQKLARAKIIDIYSRGKIPLLVGGTGYYMNAILYNYEFSNYISKDIDKYLSIEDMLIYLKNNFPESYYSIDIKNERRIINAYKYAINENKSITNNISGKKIYSKYKPYIIVVDRCRENLYNRINMRVKFMIKEGVIGEVEHILYKYGEDLQAIKSIGYKEILLYLKGNIELENIESIIAQNTRHFAKRQLTWFRNKMTNTNWYNIDNDASRAKIFSDVEKFLMVDNDENN